MARRGIRDFSRPCRRCGAPVRRRHHERGLVADRGSAEDRPAPPDHAPENLARILGIAIDRCSVKATTNETIGFAGRREGIAAIATATVVFGGKS
jgi:rRNA maturation endonuclease Nob1